MHQILQRLRQLISPNRRPRTKTVQVDVQDLELLLNDYDRIDYDHRKLYKENNPQFYPPVDHPANILKLDANVAFMLKDALEEYAKNPTFGLKYDPLTKRLFDMLHIKMVRFLEAEAIEQTILRGHRNKISIEELRELANERFINKIEGYSNVKEI